MRSTEEWHARAEKFRDAKEGFYEAARAFCKRYAKHGYDLKAEDLEDAMHAAYKEHMENP